MSQTSSATAPARTCTGAVPASGRARPGRAQPAGHDARGGRSADQEHPGAAAPPAEPGREHGGPRDPGDDRDDPPHPDAPAGGRRRRAAGPRPDDPDRPAGRRRQRHEHVPRRRARVAAASGGVRRRARRRRRARVAGGPGATGRRRRARGPEHHVLDYAGLVEAARANNRQGLPVGAQYLREASNGLRADALPVADALVQANTDRSAASLNTGWGWVVPLLALAALALLVVVQLRVARQFRRRINAGLLVSSLLLLGLAVASLGLMIALLFTTADSRSSFDDASNIGTARVQANLAKSSESLTLIARGSGKPYEDAWKAADAEVVAHLPLIRDSSTFGRSGRPTSRSTPRSAASTTAGAGTTPSSWPSAPTRARPTRPSPRSTSRWPRTCPAPAATR